jgi:ferredoxin
MAKSIVLFYFSGTGNTKWTCEEFERQYSPIGQITLFDIDRYKYRINAAISLANNVDVIGFAYPIYGANIPRIMSEFIDEINSVIAERKNGLVITTVGYINGYGPYMVKKKLNKGKIRECWHEVIPYFDNKKGIGSQDIELIQKRVSKQIESLITKIKHDKEYYGGVGPYLLPGYIIRAIIKNKVADHYKKMNVDRNKCVLCLKCMENCPTEAISIANEVIEFNSKCTSCFRCINGCGQKAIKYRNN